jgi:hypothetical protein
MLFRMILLAQKEAAEQKHMAQALAKEHKEYVEQQKQIRAMEKVQN